MIEEIRFVWFGEVTDDLAHSNNLELAPQLSMNFIASFNAVVVSVVVESLLFLSKLLPPK